MAMARLPQIAIVGRPNVGKSSLLNRLAGRRISIVDPTPGVTRDRVAAIVELPAPTETPRGTPGLTVEFIDTGGYGVYTAEGKQFDDIGADLSTLTGDIESQIKAALAQADLILFVIDAQAGLTSLDHAIAELIRRHGYSEKVLPVANKCDGEEWLAHGFEAASLGFGEPPCVSATSKFGVRRLNDAIFERVSQITARSPATFQEAASQELQIAIVGKRNSGKSTLINAWAGEDRVIVSEIAGTTRDSVDVRFQLEDRTVLAIDTAGVRKRKSFADDIEFYAQTRMLSAIKRADVVLLLVDATAEVSQVDQKLSQELQEHWKPTIIVVTKWDLADRNLKTEQYLEYITQQLRGLEYAPIIFISAKTGEGLRDLISMAFNLHEQAHHRESTSRLNDTITEIMKQRGPSAKGGKRAKVLYISQVDVNPPSIVMVLNHPKLFEGNYERYLLNELREVVPFSEVPIRLIFKQRERMPLDEMKARGKRTAAASEASAPHSAEADS
jgi:GTP-binding protein